MHQNPQRVPAFVIQTEAPARNEPQHRRFLTAHDVGRGYLGKMSLLKALSPWQTSVQKRLIRLLKKISAPSV